MSNESLNSRVRVSVDPAVDELRRQQAEKAATARVFSSQDNGVGGLSGGPLSEDEKRRVQALIDRVGQGVPTREQQNADIGRAFYSAHQREADQSKRVDAGLQAAESEQRAQAFVGRLNGAELNEQQKQAMRERIDSVSEQEAFLRNRMRGERDVTPEDTLAELREDVGTVGLRHQMAGVPGVSPEDTRAELLDEQARAAEKQIGKDQEAEGMRLDRLETARRMTEQQARLQAERDIEEHASILASGPKWDQDAFYLRNDMAERMQANAAYAAALQATAPDLAKRVSENERENVTVNVAANMAKNMDTPEAVKAAGRDIAQHDALAALGTKNALQQAEGLRMEMATRQGANPAYAAALQQAAPELAKRVEAQDSQATVDKALDAQLEDDLRRRKAREAEQAGQGLNTVDVQRSGRELDRGEFIMPRQLAKNYNEVDGKFFTKDADRPLVMFEDKGDKLATSTTDKQAISDMVMLAKAKQWDSLKLTGSQDFRREAWLQAESQGIKTQGYTPKQADMAALEALRQQRTVNAITPVQERKAERETQQERETIKAPRHDLNKNQAALHTEASKLIATNMQALQKQPAFADRSVEDLTKLAYWRGIVSEENKRQPEGVKNEALARFDKQAEDPKFLQRLDKETRVDMQEKTSERVTERVTTRATYEQSL